MAVGVVAGGEGERRGERGEEESFFVEVGCTSKRIIMLCVHDYTNATLTGNRKPNFFVFFPFSH